MRKITTEIEIAAQARDVWAVLMDFSSYGEWNPFIIGLEGKPDIGARLEARLQPPGGKAMTFKPTITAIEEERFFQWVGKVGFKGVFDGRHSFRLSPTGHGIRFEHSEQFTGILAGLIIKKIGNSTEAGFTAMNEALKARAESV